jgi:hypothetical protein
MNYNRLPYKQFSSTDFLSTTERFYKKKNENNNLKKFKSRPRRWSIDHLHSNKYFSYTHPLNSHYCVEKQNPFKNIQKKRKRSNSLCDILYNIKFKNSNKNEILWNNLFKKIKKNDYSRKVGWCEIFNNIYNRKRYNIFNNFSPKIEL